MTEETTNVESPTTLVTETQEEGAPTETTPDSPTDGTSTEEAPTDYNFTVPEGMEVNEPLMEEFVAFAKAENLSPEVGQKLIDMQARFEKQNYETSQKQWTTLQEEWTNASKADTEFGGQEMTANLAIAKKTIDQFGTPELKEMLDFTGAGNHPEIIRLFYRVGKAISDDKLVIGEGSTSPAPKTQAEILFGK